MELTTKLEQELDNLSDNIIKLELFIRNPDKFDDLDPVQKKLLKVQLFSMKTYAECLVARLELLTNKL